MGNANRRFTHQSLQDPKTVKTLLTALSRGFSKGEMTLSDGDDEMVMKVDGLLTVRIKAEQDDGRNEVSLRVSWSDPATPTKPKGAPRIES